MNDTRAKALAYLRDGKVEIRQVRYEHKVVAYVHGHRGRYVIDYTAGTWTCTCRAGMHGQVCPHLAAVQLVIAPHLSAAYRPLPEQRAG